VYTALNIVDLILNSPKPVITVLSGCAMSAAAVLFACGTRRFMTKNSTIMIHDVSMELIEGKLRDVQVESREMQRLNQRMYSIMASQIGKADNFFDSTLREKNVDAYIGPAQALEWNLCTDIGAPRFETRVQVSYHLVLGEEDVYIQPDDEQDLGASKTEIESKTTSNRPILSTLRPRKKKQRR
jgi:ATP-dependent protease ClpP protease subunit